jgi:phospholipid-binding lipoprotein MlaA
MFDLKKYFVAFTVVVLFASTPSFSDPYRTDGYREYPKLRVVEVNPEDYRDEYKEALNSDSFETYNRAMFDFNMTVDDYFLEPIARGYRNIMPNWGKFRVRDFFNNLEEPANLVNSVLQGDVESIFRSFWRFTINTTFGIGGIYDVADGFGLKEKDKDFSQTLALYGFSSGEYVVLPLLGPSTVRDISNPIFNALTDPGNYIDSSTESVTILNLANVIQMRERLLDIFEDIEDNSFDPYSAFKSTYLQLRRKEVLQTIE